MKRGILRFDTTLTDEMKELKNEQREYRKEIKELKELNKNATQEMRQRREDLQETNNKIEEIESEKREKYIFIQCLSIDTDNPNVLTQAMVGFSEKKMELTVKVNEAKR